MSTVLSSSESFETYSCLWDADIGSKPFRSDMPSTCRVDPNQVEGTVCDVAIVGGGLTGLWTAFYLHELDPSLDIVLIEARVPGFGASGRNGGWCSPILPMSLPAIERASGRGAAIAARRAMVETVDEVERQVTRCGFDCDFVKGGSVELVRNPAQERRALDHLAVLRSFGIPEEEIRLVRGRELSDIVRAEGTKSAILETQSAALHPGRLSRRLAHRVRTSGVRLFEGVAALRIEPGRVLTDHGAVAAPISIRATEAFTADLPGHRRTLLPLYSLMIATEPLSLDEWSEIGLENRTTFTDGRRMLVYGQRTADGRFAFGGRGAPYHFGSRLKPSFDIDADVARHLERELHRLFPSSRRAAVTHHWGGPLGVPRDWTCSVTFDPTTGLGSAGGYVGDGVAMSNLAGRTLADLILRRRTDIVTLPWVGHRSPQWELEPTRWIAVNALTLLAGMTDRIENRSGREARILGSIIRRFSGS